MNDRNHSMRQGSSGPRRSSRGGRHGGGGNGGEGGNRPSPGGPMRGDNRPRSAAHLRNQSFDSNGPDVRVRGNAWQVYEKYQSLARDAASSGDRVMAENYLQHAEHYFRVTEAIEEATAAEARQRGVSPQAPFGSQPDMPTSYYTPEGKGPAVPAGQQPQPATGAMPQPQPAAAPVGTEQRTGEPEGRGQAEVTRRTPPPAPNPFFTPDDTDDNGSNPQTLVAGR